MKKEFVMKVIICISNFICTIGAINWGLIAFLHFNFVEYIAKYIPISIFNLIIYGLIGIAGIFSLVILIMNNTCYKK